MRLSVKFPRLPRIVTVFRISDFAETTNDMMQRPTLRQMLEQRKINVLRLDYMNKVKHSVKKRWWLPTDGWCVLPVAPPSQRHRNHRCNGRLVGTLREDTDSILSMSTSFLSPKVNIKKHANECGGETSELLTFGNNFIHLIWLFHPASGISFDRSGTNEGLKVPVVALGWGWLVGRGLEGHVSHFSTQGWSGRSSRWCGCQSWLRGWYLCCRRHFCPGEMAIWAVPNIPWP